MFASRVRIILSVLISACLVSAIYLTQPQQVEAGIIRTTITDNYYTCETFGGTACQASNWVFNGSL